MLIRNAKKDDAMMITTQNIALAKETEKIILKPKTVLLGVKALLSDKTKGFYLVAEEKNKIIGQLMVTVEWSDWRNKPIWWIQSVYVQKEWQNKGVFTQLLQDVQKKAYQQKVAFLRLYVHMNNRTALQIYQKVGWKQEPYHVCYLPL